MPNNTTKDRDWDLQDFLDLTPTEVSPRHNELLLGSPDPDLTNIGTEDEIDSVTERPEGQRTTTASVGADQEDQPITRKRRRTATIDNWQYWDRGGKRKCVEASSGRSGETS